MWIYFVLACLLCYYCTISVDGQQQLSLKRGETTTLYDKQLSYSSLYYEVDGNQPLVQQSFPLIDEQETTQRLTSTPQYIITTFAGTGSVGSSGDNGAAISAQLYNPYGVAADSSARVYIADQYNQKIRMVMQNSSSSTLEPTPSPTSVPTPATKWVTSALSQSCTSACIASFGTAYGCDLPAMWAIDSLTKTQALGCPGTTAASASGGWEGNVPFVDINMYSTCFFNLPGQNQSTCEASHIYRHRFCACTQLPPVPTQAPTKMQDAVSTYAGSGISGNVGDSGAATSAELNGPRGVAVDASGSTVDRPTTTPLGNVYVADLFNHKIRLIGNNGLTLPVVTETTVNLQTPSTFIGNSNAAWIWTSGDYNTISNNGNSIPFSGSFVSTTAYTGTIEVCVDDFATVYFNGQLVDGNNFFIYSPCFYNYSPQQASISVIVGTNHIVANAQNTGGPAGFLLSVKDNLGHYVYQTDSSWTYQPSKNIISTYAGTGIAGSTGDGGAAISAQLHGPSGVSIDTSRNVYISDKVNHKIRKVSSTTGIITTYAGTGTAGSSGDGGAATSAQLNSPEGTIMDSLLNLYIADTYNHKIRKVSSTTGIITTFTGTGTAGSSGDHGAAVSAQLHTPVAVTVDALGIYIADSNNNKIRLVTFSTGIITTFVGTGRSGTSGDGGLAITAQLCNPQGLVMDVFNNLYITDFYNNRVRMVNNTGIITTVVGTGTGGSSTSFTYVGCYVDGTTNGYGLRNLLYRNQPGYLACFQQAQLLGYRYVAFDAWNAGWQAGAQAGECWGGNNLASAESQGTSINCNLAVTADGNFLWGGGYSMALYDTAASSNALNGPLGAAADALGNVYIADFYHNTIQLVVPPPVQTPSPTSSPSPPPPSPT